MHDVIAEDIEIAMEKIKMLDINIEELQSNKQAQSDQVVIRCYPSSGSKFDENLDARLSNKEQRK